MDNIPDYGSYATKMRRLVGAGTDMEVDVRFVDMMIKRNASVLDIGCGIGNAVSGLRNRGHDAYGVDPTAEVLEVAREHHNGAWFRRLAAVDTTSESLALAGLPQSYDAIIMSGNVPSFLTDSELKTSFAQVPELLNRGGIFILGTTTNAKGGPVAQDLATSGAGLTLMHRFSDWHLTPFHVTSPWSVSIFCANESREFSGGPDGIFILPGSPEADSNAPI